MSDPLPLKAAKAGLTQKEFLPLEQLQGINDSLKAIAKNGTIDAPVVNVNIPDTQEITIKGVSVLTLKGDKGDTPTDSQLLALIKPLIPPRAVDGKTPKKEELLALIRPLIPIVEDGETPTDERLLALITPLIPQVKDGSSDTGDQIIDKINGSEEQIDRERVKGLDDELKRIGKNRPTSLFGGGMSQPLADGHYVKYHGGASNLTVSATAPPNPELYDLWIDISSL